MRIGIDFDNTLVRYDRVFAQESRKAGITPAGWNGTKQELRDELRSRLEGERLWQTLQGRVYGSCMHQAEMFPGVASFLLRSQNRGDELFIVSHKTEYGHFDTTRTPLRKAALNWMEMNRFFDPDRFNLDKNKVFFGSSRREKISQITHLNCDIFIDDLEEVFAEEEFPPIRKILFSREAKGKHHDIHCKNWAEISQFIQGDMTASECRSLVASFCPEEVSEVRQCPGRGNSRVYRIENQVGRVFALKCYPDLLLDPRPRLRNEINACDLLKSLKSAPVALAHDEDLNFGLFEWIEGESPGSIEPSHVDQALTFVEHLKHLSRDTCQEFSIASEACLSQGELTFQIEDRLRVLSAIKNPELKIFLETIVRPLWGNILPESRVRWPDSLFEEELPRSLQTLSSSDFGFHNSLEKRDGSLCFIDHEYFGWDDPIKLMADFLWHPAMNLSDEHKQRWLHGTFEIFGEDPGLQTRFRAAWPLYGMRWVLILLNEFREDGWLKRRHAQLGPQQNREHRQALQLQKARGLCEILRSQSMACPYE